MGERKRVAVPSASSSPGRDREEGHLDLVQWLHALGAPLNVTCKNGHKPAMLAPPYSAVVAWLNNPVLPLWAKKERGRHNLAKWRTVWRAWCACNYLWKLYGERQGRIDGAFGRRAAAAFKADQEAGMGGGV